MGDRFFWWKVAGCFLFLALGFWAWFWVLTEARGLLA